MMHRDTLPADPVQTILLAGVGGQGVILAGDVLAETALAAGFDVKKSEVHGLSRRFGSVSCQVRIGCRLLSPLGGHGAVDLLVALEVQEGLRHLPFLKAGGVALVNRLWIAAKGGAAAPPPELGPDADPRIRWLNGTQETHEARAIVESLNFYMLGVTSHFVPLPAAAWNQTLKRLLPPRYYEVNGAMFARGRRAWSRLLRPRAKPLSVYGALASAPRAAV